MESSRSTLSTITRRCCSSGRRRSASLISSSTLRGASSETPVGPRWSKPYEFLANPPLLFMLPPHFSVTQSRITFDFGPSPNRGNWVLQEFGSKSRLTFILGRNLADVNLAIVNTNAELAEDLVVGAKFAQNLSR